MCRPPGAAIAIAAVLAPALAVANGRPPATTGIAFNRNDPAALYVRSTFGLLISTDGCSFRWVCERAIGYSGEFDPKYAIAADGTIFATTFEGLRVSRDGGCTWTTATASAPKGDGGNLVGIWIDAIDISVTGEVWIATAESAQPNDVYSSIDAGITFRPRGLRSATIWWKSVKVSKRNPQRVYVGGYQVAGVAGGRQVEPRAHLRRSSDGGSRWTELPLRDMKFGATPILVVAAVDPAQPDTVLVTSLGANGKGDRLYRSTNAGVSFTEVLATTDAIKDVVFATNGVVYAASPTGSFKSTDNGASFEPLAGSPHLGCLGARPGTSELVGCGTSSEPDGMAVATTRDAITWSKAFRFGELAGPLACPAGTTSAKLCDPLWPSIQQQFGATAPTNCKPAPTPVAPTPTPKPLPASNTGCCNSSASGSPAILLLLVFAFRASARSRRAPA